MRLCFLVSLFAITRFAVTSFAATPDLRSVVHVRNFGVVNEHLLRGGEPTPEGLSELSAVGAKVIIDLRETGPATVRERQEVEKLGMKYKNVPLPPLAAPSPNLLRAVLDLLSENNSQTVFVHCHRGKDRTGTVVACYRIQHDGWNAARAMEEANRFGMSSLERGMRAFIVHFTPATNIADPPLVTSH